MAKQKKLTSSGQRFREAADLALEFLSDRSLNVLAWRMETLVTAVRRASGSFEELSARDQRVARRAGREVVGTGGK